MNIVIIGASGFIGINLIKSLLRQRHNIVATFRNIKPNIYDKKVQWKKLNINKPVLKQYLVEADVVIHLAWDKLPNYHKEYHLNNHFVKQKKFIKTIIKFGVTNLFVLGTCFEYGKQEGELKENFTPKPVTPYGIAKNKLRIEIEKLNKKIKFKYTWARLFYVYGDHQSKTSIYSQLKNSISKKKSFKMSLGNQTRDFMNISKACKIISILATNNKSNGIVNICTQKPIKLRKLVLKWIKIYKSNIKIIYGFYKMPDYEPMHFWGSNKKMKKLILK